MNDTSGIASMVPYRNGLLTLLPERDRIELAKHFEPVDLILKDALETPGLSFDYIYFLESGIVSMISLLEDGSQIEVGLIGNEGFLGIPLLLGRSTATLEALVQVRGRANRMPAAVFLKLLDASADLRHLMLRYVDSFYSQVVQTAVCNGRHQIEKRLCRWLLMSHDRIEGDVVEVTQGFLSTMLGVQRPGITLAIGELTKANLVVPSRGSLRIIDREGLERAACECYRVVRRTISWEFEDGMNARNGVAADARMTTPADQKIGMPPATGINAPDV